MEPMPVPQDSPGFFVEWQLADDTAIGEVRRVIDLTADRPDVELVLTDDAGVRIGSGA